MKAIWDTAWQFLWGDIPWQAWFALGLAGSVALFIMLPKAAHLNELAAVALLVTTIATSAYGRGVAWEKAYWLAQVEEQRVALQKKVDTAVAREALAAQQADAAERQLQKERDDAIANTGPNGGRVVIPPDTARRLYDIGQPQAPSDNP